MHGYTESYPTVCVGQILTYPSYGGPQDHCWRAFNVHLDNQFSRLVSRVQRVQKGHTMTHVSPLLLIWLLSSVSFSEVTIMSGSFYLCRWCFQIQKLESIPTAKHFVNKSKLCCSSFPQRKFWLKRPQN